jgi:hypothetical protein
MESQYEVLSPWAEADPVPLLSLAPRLSDLNHKKIGLFVLTYKHASARVQSVVEKRLKEKFPTAEFNRFERNQGADFDEVGFQNEASKKALVGFEEWVRGVDAVIGAVGD